MLGKANSVLVIVAAAGVLVLCGSVSAEEFELTVNVVGNGIADPNGGTYESGTVVTIETWPDAGHWVKSWSGSDDDASSERINTVTMTSNKVVTVEFAAAMKLAAANSSRISSDQRMPPGPQPRSVPFPPETKRAAQSRRATGGTKGTRSGSSLFSAVGLLAIGSRLPLFTGGIVTCAVSSDTWVQVMRPRSFSMASRRLSIEAMTRWELQPSGKGNCISKRMPGRLMKYIKH